MFGNDRVDYLSQAAPLRGHVSAGHVFFRSIRVLDKQAPSLALFGKPMERGPKDNVPECIEYDRVYGRCYVERFRAFARTLRFAHLRFQKAGEPFARRRCDHRVPLSQGPLERFPQKIGPEGGIAVPVRPSSAENRTGAGLRDDEAVGVIDGRGQ